MPRFLSPTWFEAARRPGPAAATGAAVVVLEQSVTGGPDGDVVYRVHAGSGRAWIEWPVPDDAPPADLRIRSDWATAVAVARGTLSAQRALMDGRLTLSGNPAELAGVVDTLAGSDAVPAELRRHTTYLAS